MRLCAVSVDLDEIPNYFGIHGLETPEKASTAVYDAAVPRLLSFSRDARVPLTLFAIGRDLDWPEAATRLRDAHVLGAEIANHSLDHHYDLTRRSREEISAQIRGGAHAIERAVGTKPVGFRAPGYTITDEVFDVLREIGVAYDSSVFPCPAYWAAKAAAIGLHAIQGRVSKSVIDTANVLRAPVRPYFAGKPFWKRGGGDAILEIPIQVTRGLRLPFIGTSLTLAGPERAAWLTQMCVGEPLINLELHGIDVLDENDGLEELRDYQPDVRVSLETKLKSLNAVVSTLRAAGYAFTTLHEAATEFV